MRINANEPTLINVKLMMTSVIECLVMLINVMENMEHHTGRSYGGKKMETKYGKEHGKNKME